MNLKFKFNLNFLSRLKVATNKLISTIENCWLLKYVILEPVAVEEGTIISIFPNTSFEGLLLCCLSPNHGRYACISIK